MRNKLTPKERKELEGILKKQCKQLKMVEKLRADIKREIKEVEDILENDMPILPINALLHLTPPQNVREK